MPGLGPFVLDMARAIPARDEDHRRRTNPGEIACIVAGRRQDQHRRQVVLARRLRDQFTQVRIELIRWRVDQRRHRHRAWRRVLVAKRCDADAGRIEHRINFGTTHPDHVRRYEMASEFIDVVKACGTAGRMMRSSPTASADSTSITPSYHDGAFFKVKGPFNIGRSPQGHPVVLQAGGSEAGQSLAACTADIVFSVVQDMEEAKAGYATLKDRLPAFGRRPEDVTVLPGVMPIVGRTDKEAFEKLNVLQSFISGSNALAILSDRFGRDMSAYDLDGPVPDLEPSDSYHSFASVMLAKARRENMTLRDLYNLTAAARGHWVLCGSAERIADTLQQWFVEHAADGFNVMPSYFHEGFEDFAQLVVPILQERGLFRADYDGMTLRDHLGLPRPENPRF